MGGARQYCGTLGKVENCQVGVFAGYASRHGYALVDKRLFLPEVWWTDAYAGRRTTCNVPAALTLQSKPQLAAAMLQTIAQEALLPFKYVVADCLYPEFEEPRHTLANSGRKNKENTGRSSPILSQNIDTRISKKSLTDLCETLIV